MSKGNYYSGSPIGTRIVDDGRIDEFMAKYLIWILLSGAIGLGVLFYKGIKKEENKPTKTEQVMNKPVKPQNVIAYNNVHTL